MSRTAIENVPGFEREVLTEVYTRFKTFNVLNVCNDSHSENLFLSSKNKIRVYLGEPLVNISTHLHEEHSMTFIRNIRVSAYSEDLW